MNSLATTGQSTITSTFGHVRRRRSIYREVWHARSRAHLTLAPEGEPVTGCYWRPRFGRRRSARKRNGPSKCARYCSRRPRGTCFPTFRLRCVPVWRNQLVGGAGGDGATSDQPITAFYDRSPGLPARRTATPAARVAAHLGCGALVAGPLPDVVPTPLASCEEVQRCYDSPCGHAGPIPSWFESQLASRQVKGAAVRRGRR